MERILNPMSLESKKILILGDSSGIDDSIIRTVTDLGADLRKFNWNQTDNIESNLKGFILENGPFDGFVFSMVKSDFRPLKLVKPKVVEEIMDFNFCSFVESVRALIKHKGLKNNSSVVALSSISSIRAMKAKMAFCSAKAALDAAVRCFAVELADMGIRINSVQKGYVDTDFDKAHIQNLSYIKDNDSTQKPPLGVTSSVELANLVAFLLSDATLTLTGTSIVLDGGLTA